MSGVTADSVRLARTIATEALRGNRDLLIACRRLAEMRLQLSFLPDDSLDTFVAIASEIDDLPIGDERNLWSSDALVVKDAEIRDYRERVRPTVIEALESLLAILPAS